MNYRVFPAGAKSGILIIERGIINHSIVAFESTLDCFAIREVVLADPIKEAYWSTKGEDVRARFIVDMLHNGIFETTCNDLLDEFYGCLRIMAVRVVNCIKHGLFPDRDATILSEVWRVGHSIMTSKIDMIGTVNMDDYGRYLIELVWCGLNEQNVDWWTCYKE